MKEIFDSFTRAEVEIIASGNISPELKAIFKREGISQKEAIAFAKEALKYIADEATEEEQIDEETYFKPEAEATEPSENFEEVEQEVDEKALFQEIEQATQPTGKKKTALERLAMLKTLAELEKKHQQYEGLLQKISYLIEEHEESENVSLQIQCAGKQGISITKNFAVDKCLLFVKEETDKQLKAIETEIEALDF